MFEVFVNAKTLSHVALKVFLLIMTFAAINRKEYLYCPILSRKIPIEICEDVANVSEDFHPERFAPQEFRNVEDYKEFCRKCINNPYN